MPENTVSTAANGHSGNFDTVRPVDDLWRGPAEPKWTRARRVQVPVPQVPDHAQRSAGTAAPTQTPTRTPTRRPRGERPLSRVERQAEIRREKERKQRRGRFGRYGQFVAGGAVLLTALAIPTVHSLRNAGPAAANGVIADDTFARSVSGGWGSATVGGEYTVTPSTSSSVAPGQGILTLTPGYSVSSVLRSSGALNVDASVALSVPKLPTSGSVYTMVLLRRQANRDSYRARARVLSTGEVRLSFTRMIDGVEAAVGGEKTLGFKVTAGQRLMLETEVEGTSPVTLRSKAWVTTAPSAWGLVVFDSSSSRVTDSGAFGVLAYLSSSAQAATVNWHNLHAIDTDAAAQTPTPTVPATTTPAAQPSVTASSTATSTISPSQTAPPSTTGRAADNAGSAAVGSTSYAVPAGALFVSPSGSDTAGGSASAPLRTVVKAISVASNGSTIVLRAGTYHESVTIPSTKRITLQAYPKEAVWFDGSSVVSGWSASGNVWVHSGWSASFDSTPCYSAGSCSSSGDFNFLQSGYPMAAHPDQVFFDGVQQQQVGSLSQVSSGKFYVDYSTDKLYVGSNPSGHTVNASDLAEAITVRSAGSIVRGLGVHRYGTPLPKMATVKAVANDVTLENLVVNDNATTGVSALQLRDKINHVTANGNGMLGFHANYADGLSVTGIKAQGNNIEHFKTAPVAGGIKVTRTRGVVVRDSVLTNNLGTGVWMDESVYDSKIIGNDIQNNGSHGISVEISAKSVVANNVITGSSRDGIKINDTEYVWLWNNTFSGNNRTVEVVQDNRLGSRLSDPGHDPRQTLPDPTMTWLVGKVSIGNNVFSYPRSEANCVLCVEDYSHVRSAEQMVINSNGNLYNRASSTVPKYVSIWSNGAGNPDVFTTLNGFVSATGQEKASGYTEGSAMVASDGSLAASGGSVSPQALPSDVAALVGQPSGTRHLGAWTG